MSLPTRDRAVIVLSVRCGQHRRVKSGSEQCSAKREFPVNRLYGMEITCHDVHPSASVPHYRDRRVLRGASQKSRYFAPGLPYRLDWWTTTFPPTVKSTVHRVISFITQGHSSDAICLGVRRCSDHVVVYHIEFVTREIADLFADLHPGMVWVTWKEITGGASLPTTPSDVSPSLSVYHWPVEQMAAYVCRRHMGVVPHVESHLYQILYHGTAARNVDSILRTGLRAGSEAGMMGRGVYFGSCGKACRFAIATSAEDRQAHEGGGAVARCIVDMRGVRLKVLDVTGAGETECMCRPCVSGGRHTLRRRLVDHEGLWKNDFDILRIPPSRHTSLEEEWVVADESRIRVLSMNMVHAVPDPGAPTCPIAHFEDTECISLLLRDI